MKTKLLFLLVFAFALFSLKAQTSLNFDGVNDYVLGTNNNSLDLTQGTLEAWIKTDNAGSEWRAIINKQEAFGIYLYDNKLAIWDMGNWNGIYTTVNLADNIWHHIAFSFNNNVVNGTKLFVNGLPILTTTIGTPISLNKIVIGASKGSTGYIQYFNGEIDQVRVWNTVRTDAEILANYNKCLLGNESGLVMYWNFDEGTGTSVTDLSGNNNNGTLTNMDAATDWVNGYDCSLVAYYPFNGNANDESGNANHGTINGATLTTDRNGNLERAYSFDGVNDIITVNHSTNLNMEGELSISVWVKPTTLSNAMILGKSNYTSNTNYLLRTKTTGFLQFEYKKYANSTNNPLIAGQWNHIAVISEADNTKKIYVNNVLSTHTESTSPYGVVTDILTIGARSGAEFFQGAIDDLRIYNKALSEAEILNLYNYNTLKVEKIEDVANSSFYVFNNTLYFKNTQNLNEIKTIEVYNLLGQQVFKTSDIQEVISLQQLQKGIYILKVKTSNTNQSLKFIIN